jgi:predicted RNA-binding Zn-ribbon protein involved in translation (DUF1610 family)
MLKGRRLAPAQSEQPFMIECLETNDVSPVCPHCGVTLNKIWCRRLSSLSGVRYVYFCPHCRKALGVSHRKGFWLR